MWRVKLELRRKKRKRKEGMIMTNEGEQGERKEEPSS